jgi:hypothetical protein
MIWLALTAASVAGYALCYRSFDLAPQYYSATLMERVHYFLVFLGMPLVYGATNAIRLAPVAGAAVCLLHVGVLGWMASRPRSIRGRAWIDMLPWLAISGYGFGSAMLGALGRAGLGAEQAMMSRYTTLSMAALIGLVGMFHVSASVAEPRAWRRFAIPIAAAIAVGVVWSGVQALPSYVNAQRHLRTAAGHLAFIEQHMEPRAPALIGYRSDLRELAERISQAGYLHPRLIANADIAQLAPAGQSGIGAVEMIRQAPGAIRAAGWAALPDGSRGGDVVLITAPDANGAQTLRAIADVSIDRPDVAAAVSPRLLRSGWSADIPAANASPAPSELRFWVFDAEAQQAYPLPVRASP